MAPGAPEDAGLDGCSLAAEGDGGWSQGVESEPGGEAAWPWLRPCSSGRTPSRDAGVVLAEAHLAVTFRRAACSLLAASPSYRDPHSGTAVRHISHG